MPPTNMDSTLAALANGLTTITDALPVLGPFITNALQAKDAIIAQKDKEIDVPIAKETDNVKLSKLLIDELKETMKIEDGVGIAAPQIGVHDRVDRRAHV